MDGRDLWWLASTGKQAADRLPPAPSFSMFPCSQSYIGWCSFCEISFLSPRLGLWGRV